MLGVGCSIGRLALLSNKTHPPIVGVPAAPSISLAPNSGARQVAIYFSDVQTEDPITSHNIYRRANSGDAAVIATTGTASPYFDAGLQPGVTYSYRLSAVNGFGEGAQSDERSITL